MSSNLSKVTELLWGRCGGGAWGVQVHLSSDPPRRGLLGSRISPYEYLPFGDWISRCFLCSICGSLRHTAMGKQENSTKRLPQTLVKIRPPLEEKEMLWLWSSAGHTDYLGSFTSFCCRAHPQRLTFLGNSLGVGMLSFQVILMCSQEWDPHIKGTSFSSCTKVVCDYASVSLIRSDQISHSVVSNSLRPNESQHTRPPCPSPTPRVHSDSRPSSQ